MARILTGPWGGAAANDEPTVGAPSADDGSGAPVSPLVGLTPAELLALDEAARQRLRTDLDADFLVEAAAGTGKTTELVARLVAVLRGGRATIDQVAALTFTHKAAGEMKLRLRRELDAARETATDALERAHLEQAVARLEEARIGTIHAFCAELLRERPLEARVDPGFEALDEERALGLYRRTFRRWLEDRLEQLPPGLRRALERLVERGGGVEDTAVDALAEVGWSLVAWRDHPAPWRRDPGWNRGTGIASLLADARELAARVVGAAASSDALARSVAPVVDLVAWVDTTEAAGPRDEDALEARLLGLARELRRHRWAKGRGPFLPGVSRASVVELRDRLAARLAVFAAAADADLAAELQAELVEVGERYAAAKRAAGALDFEDLLLLARDLLRRDESVRRHLAERLRVVFVDEFQDTDPLQVELLLLLVADDPAESDWRRTRPRRGSLLLVGDPKQSIYRFRRADVILYQQVRDHLVAQGVEMLHLARNFRSVRPIQEAVNAAFSDAMREDRASGQPAYVPLAEHRPAHPEQPAVVALPVPRPFGYRDKVTATAVEQSAPLVVASFLAWLLADSGWTVEDPDRPGNRVAIAPDHVCLLFRRYSSWDRDVTRPYVDAFDRLCLPYVVHGGRSFHEREEVEALRIAASAVEWPDDELAVYAFLRGPFCGCTDDQLLRARTRLGRLHPFRRPSAAALADWPAELDAVTAGLAELATRHRRRNQIPYAATLEALLRFGRAHAALALRPAGNLALAHLGQLLAAARRADSLGLLSFRAFVERLEEDAVRGVNPAVSGEGSGEGVRLMTLHAAKGLEFPVVILVDPTTALARNDPERHVDAERGLAAIRLPRLGAAPADLLDHRELEHRRDVAEGLRVAYVAATRARDLLVVTSLSTEVPVVLRPSPPESPREPWWLDALLPALWPAEHFRARPAAAPGCPPFGSTTVAVDPAEHVDALRPGLHQPARGSHGVVWWDPESLPSVPTLAPGVRFHQLLKVDDGNAATDGLAAYHDWQRQQVARRAQGEVPSVLAVRSLEANEPPAALLAGVELAVLPRAAARPAGARFGSLLHAILEAAPLAADGPELVALARSSGRLLGATEDEIAAAAAAAGEVLASPWLAPLGAAERVHRELPVVLPVTLDDGRAAIGEGIIDLAYLADGRWTVIDFKTDREVASALPAYRRQVAWYVWALEQATGVGGRGILLVC